MPSMPSMPYLCHRLFVQVVTNEPAAAALLKTFLLDALGSVCQ